MPFKSFETATIEVDGNVSSLIVVHSAPLMRMGIASALRLFAGLNGRTVHQGGSLAEVSGAIREAGRGAILIADVSTWTALEKDATGLRDHVRETPIAVALVACADESAHRLLQLRGVSGVVNPECEARELELAISEIADGKTYFKHENRLAPTSGMAKLSSRQVEILELMTRGLLNKQIAWELGVTEGTVKSHVSAILEKLGCDRRTQAIAAFLQSLGVGTSASTPRQLNA
ncbi:Transcriptional regulator, LuxR family [Beijerinckiaceae bacterium RH AL1]|nr:Transcriptional regulator, LuxR family [Beijerinckiaceae bacterium RH CH11]VVB45872.1 Transcriptional regulator, LuxR family [Beijerinckiaceae bacterium RH AL8]VVC55045.1 Transcriptional regulator, LuxR family [Beijerinckiaceae bacterium RH AL1]